jgi:sulfur-oxidizing protein SoxZ
MANSIKIRARAKGNAVTVKALIKHPMETGLRKDKKTGKVIPALFIQEVTCKANGK